MKPSAALLIDLENFYLSRVDHFNDAGVRLDDRPSFAEDLRALVRYAGAVAGMPFAVRRAYADFDSLKVNPQELMRQGVEPVQVFRLSGKTAGKNAADMKLAMDAVALGAPVEHFVLVSGDADFIPVILELKRRGHTVSVLAVSGATNEFIQHFADNFELFEARAAGERSPASGDLAAVGAAVRRLLARVGPVRLDVVQPRLSKELGYPFEASAFGCASTGEFLRRHRAALGVELRGALNDQEIALPPAPVAGVKVKVRPAKAVAPPAPEPHTAAHYRVLLASGRADGTEARVLTVPWPALVWVCDAVVPALLPPTGAPATSIELLPRVQAAARATGVPDLDRYAAQIHAAVRCSLPVPSTDGVYSLHPGTTGAHIRRQLLRYIVHVLGRRLAEGGVSGAIRPEVVAEMFDPGRATDAVVAEVNAALAVEEQVAPAAPPAPIKPGRADDVHSAASYRRLLQNGGPKDSGETEHMRVHPVPWPAVERVCAEAFALLAPAAGGAPMARGLFIAKLYAAAQETRVEKYESHVRRAVALLTLSNALLEGENQVTLHPDVTDAGDIRWAALGIMLRLLAVRLEEKGVSEPIRTRAFVEAIDAGPLTDGMVPEITRAIAGMYHPADEALADTIDASTTPTVADGEPVEVVPAAITAESGDHTPGYRPEPPDADPFAFDAALPDTPAPAARRSGAEPETSDDVDVAALTSAAVAAVQPVEDDIPLAVRVGDGATDEDSIFSDAEFGAERVTERLTGSSTRLAPRIAPVAPPVADDEDVLFSDPDVERITERLTGSSVRLAPRLSPADARARVARITPPS